MAFIETLSQYFRVDDFGIVATFTPSGGSLTSVNGIFENIYSEDLSVTGTVPTFACVESDVSSLAVDDVLTVDSSIYYVRTKKPDGTGATLLVLEKQT
tara:strand:- start:2274 stop:2567 length:294 start_codon:yes stop_codon:yes gene_type:complete